MLRFWRLPQRFWRGRGRGGGWWGPGGTPCRASFGPHAVPGRRASLGGLPPGKLTLGRAGARAH